MTHTPRILICIPSYQEAANIARVTRTIDAAVDACGVVGDFRLVNVDNDSPDGTSDIFVGTATRWPKVALSTGAGTRGKGANLRLFFEYALDEEADVALTLDADLESVPPDWVAEYSRSVLEAGAGISVPLYWRAWYDANQTNQIVAPMVLAVTGESVRQPIGGDYAFSPAYMRRVLDRVWPDSALGFGIDSFLVLEGVRCGDLRQVRLSGGKQHHWRSQTAEQIEAEFPVKFHTSNITLFGLLAAWPSRRGDRELSAFPVSPELESPVDEKGYALGLMTAAGDLAFARERHNPNYRFLLGGESPTAAPKLSTYEWAGVLRRVLDRAQAGPLLPGLLEAFRALFLSRVASVQPELRGMDQRDIDNHVLGIAMAIVKAPAHGGRDTRPAHHGLP